PAFGTLSLCCSLSASLSAPCRRSFQLASGPPWPPSRPPRPHGGSPPPLTVTPVAAPPWFCWFSCWVSLELAEYALFSALLDWLTSPLFEYGLLTAIGTLTFVCCELASLGADCAVLFWLLAVWVCSTCWPPLPLSPASAVPGATASAQMLTAMASHWRFIRRCSFRELRIDYR